MAVLRAVGVKALAETAVAETVAATVAATVMAGRR